MDQLHDSPRVEGDTLLRLHLEDNFQSYTGWESTWRSEIDAESSQDPPMPPTPPALEPNPGEAGGGVAPLVRLEALSSWRARFGDGVSGRLQELLLDNTDWRLPLLEILVEGRHGRERCLVTTALVGWVDPADQIIHLAVDGEALRQAAIKPYPAAGEEGSEVPTLEGAQA